MDFEWQKKSPEFKISRWIPKKPLALSQHTILEDPSQLGTTQGTTPQLGLGQLPKLLEELLRGRGFDDSFGLEDFLFPKLSQLQEALLIPQMDQAVTRLVQAYRNQEKICIYADFDLDGTSGLALMLKGLKAFGFSEVQGFQPRRLKQGYGFHAEVVEALARDGVKLIVTVDVGIGSVEACARARELGVEVIITDHHQAGPELPKALAVVNPNLPGIDCRLGYLCGAGVAFYLLRALRRGLDADLSPVQKAWNMKSVLDFFAIATITDMVPLVEDNRLLVKQGLLQLARTEHPGLKALLQALDLWGRPLTAQDVGVRFAPKLNALSRLDAEILPLDLMLVDDPKEAQALVKKVLLSNQSRLELQAEAEAETERLLENWQSKKYIFVVSEKFHRGVVGLIAQRLSMQYGVPAFVGSLDLSSQTVVGSARAPEGSVSLVETLASLGSLFERSGGHPAAAGFEFTMKHYLEIQTGLREYFLKSDLDSSGSASEDAESSNSKSIIVPYEVSAQIEDLHGEFMNFFENVGPFGVGFEVPLFLFEKLKVTGTRILKEKHLKLNFETKTSAALTFGGRAASLEALYFQCPTELMENISSGSVVDLIGEVQWNYFAGKKNHSVDGAQT